MRLWLNHLRRTPLLLFLVLYTIVSGGPFLWVMSMSLRTTPEIFDDPYALPVRLHWEKFANAWTTSNYGTYFWNSLIVVVTAVALVTLIGAMAAHCLARYRFRGSRLVRFVILSGMILPPQLLILSLFQILLDYRRYNSLAGLIIVYVATQLAMTVYILRASLRRCRRTSSMPRAWTAMPTSRSSGASPCRSACRRSSPPSRSTSSSCGTSISMPSCC
jgi:multiple sugar transport system permease protein/raffinose/stachyose/melibiose transport system permease protein